MTAKQSYDRRDIRRLNAVNVLNQLHENGSMSRANIAAKLGLTRATVSNIIAELLHSNLVAETIYDEGGAGRPGLLLCINPSYGSLLAIEIDLDGISATLADFKLKPILQESVPLDLDASPEECLGLANRLVVQMLEQSRKMQMRCLGIGVAWAGLVNRKEGRLAYGPTSGWEHVTLKSDWESRYRVPVFVENEAHAGAMAVHYEDHGQNTRNFIYLSLGVGLGAGLYVDGVLLRGKQGFAGQVGHTFFADNGIQCSCGKLGCWVTEIGASAIKRKLFEKGFVIPEVLGAGIDWVDFVKEVGQKGDPVVIDVLESVGRDLGRGTASLVQNFNPSLVIVGGRLAPLMALAEAPIREAMLAETLPYMAEQIELRVSASVQEPLRGCLATVSNYILRNPPTGENGFKP